MKKHAASLALKKTQIKTPPKPAAEGSHLYFQLPGGRDQEASSWKPARANGLQDPTLKIPITKKGWWSGSRYRPWVQTPAVQKKKKKKTSPLKFYFTSVRLVIIKKTNKNKCWWGFREKRNPHKLWWKCKLVQPLLK
jgi:hypothetical protein